MSADTNSLRVMCIFEAGARLKCSSELSSLAAHIYHRFLRTCPKMNEYELFTFAAASMKLAHCFFEKPLDVQDLALIMTCVAHGPKFYLEQDKKSKLGHSIDYAAKVITLNLNFEVTFKDTQTVTPGLLMRKSRELAAEGGEEDTVMIEESDSESKDSEDDYDYDEETTDIMLTKNSRHTIGSHRYLVHYLNTIKLLVDPISEVEFRKLCNVAWILLSDFHWSPSVAQHFASHSACACLMMAIQACRQELDCDSIGGSLLWKLVNKKWNLIFCDDLDDKLLERLMYIIAQQYEEYERVLQHEFSTYVIDPKRGEKGLSKHHR